MTKYAMIIDYKYCTGCHTCEVACRQERQIESQEEWGIKLSEFGPMKQGGEWYWDYVPVPSNLCNLCEDRLAEGKRAACAHHCLAQCMEVVPVAEVPDQLEKLGAGGVAVFMP